MDHAARTHVVIVTVDAAAEVLAEMADHARLGLEGFDAWPGYVGGDLHVSADGTRLVQRLEWDSQADWERCRDDPHWDTVPSTRRILEHVETGRARLDVRTYERVATSSTRRNSRTP